MSLAAIQAVIDAQILTGIDQGLIAFQNTTFDPAGLDHWYETQMLALNRVAVGNGPDGVAQWSGQYLVKCHAPLGTGLQQQAALVDGVTALFPRGLSLITTNGLSVIFEAPSPKPPLVEAQYVTGIAVMPWFTYEAP